MSKTFFITGTSTEVGKTIASAIITQALKADYWKPIQSGDLDYSDSHKVSQLVDFKVRIHSNRYRLKTPISPHASARIDGVNITVKDIRRPVTSNTLVIEAAGGILVPLNDRETMLDLIHPKDAVIVVSRHYLGSINHTLMTLRTLKTANISVFGIIFSGNQNKETESIILAMGGVRLIGRINEEPIFNQPIISHYADIFHSKIINL